MPNGLLSAQALAAHGPCPCSPVPRLEFSLAVQMHFIVNFAHSNGPRGHRERSEPFFPRGAAARATTPI